MNDFIMDFSYVCTLIIVTIILAAAARIKTCLRKKLDTETKQMIAKNVVYACEQMYKDLVGSEKLIKATEYFESILDESGIDFETTELRVLIESAVRQMKNDSMSILEPFTATLDCTDEDDWQEDEESEDSEE